MREKKIKMVLQLIKLLWSYSRMLLFGEAEEYGRKWEGVVAWRGRPQ